MERLRRLLLEDWPAQDRVLWQQAFQKPEDLFDEAGAAHELRPMTRRNYARAYGVWLAHLGDNGTLDPVATPAARVTPERLDGWVAAMRALDRKNNTIRQYIIDLYSMLRLIAPEADMGFLLKPRGRPLSTWLPVEEKAAAPIDITDVLKRVHALHQQGLQARTVFAKRGALRDAALLVLLAMRAPRVSNLAMMQLGQHLRGTAASLFDVSFTGDEMKAHRSLGWPLDAGCAAAVHDYIEIGRGLFPGANDTDALWLGHHGERLDEVGIAALVRRHTLAWFGIAYGPHKFRKWLRDSAARRSPEAAFDAAEVSGHSVAVSLKHYAEASEVGAALRHGEHVRALRQQTALLAKRAFARGRGG